MTRKYRRKRGAPKGNQNARKHGFYSSNFSKDDIRRIMEITAEENIDLEIAAVRLKLSSVLEHSPGNQRVIRELANLMADFSAAKYDIDKKTLKLFRIYFQETLRIKSTAALSRCDKSCSDNAEL